tara:strand:+ start:60 stop:362 length:303 start_codon:yes stop_codon:yes gene_type:complete
MAWQKTVVETRPDTDTEFYVSSSDCQTHIASTYTDTGKSISFAVSLSSNELKKTRTRVFASEANKNAFVNDEVIVADRALFIQHCEDNECSREATVDKEI